ncbi:hypothetical protein [Sporichthya brevicatena]|uniref:hypothetical protein n=1 Tax=Sporichthya brevicatena TaxID=171442 RepID=UPI0031E072D7
MVGENHAQHNPLPTVIVLPSPPAPGRQRWLAIVPRCPHCNLGHVYYTDYFRLFDGAVTRACAHTGHRFRLHPRHPGEAA